MQERLNPFYFPTSIVFIDDDQDFIDSFTMLLDEDLPIYSFTSAKKALDFINNQVSIYESLNDLTDYTLLDNADQKICLNIDTLHKQVYNQERFAQVSVVIADYAMPEMDGLELLKGIKHREVKRILLTGVADDKTAVKAFNEGYLDRFFLKNSVEIAKEVNDSIRQLQNDFFHFFGEPIQKALSEHTNKYIADPEFQKYSSKLCGEHEWVEYYILEQPQGALLLNKEGNASCLFILPKEELQSHYEYAVAEEAPKELLKIMAEGKHITWFPTPDGYYEAETCAENWKNYLYPIDFCCPEDTYFCALVEPSPLQYVDMTNVRSYGDYLEHYDKA